MIPGCALFGIESLWYSVCAISSRAISKLIVSVAAQDLNISTALWERDCILMYFQH